MSLIGRFGILNQASIHHPHGSCDKKPFISILYISYIMLCNLNIHKSFQNWYMFHVSILLHVLRVFGVFFGEGI